MISYTFQFNDLFPELHEIIFSYIDYITVRTLNNYYKILADKIELNKHLYYFEDKKLIINKNKFSKYLKSEPPRFDYFKMYYCSEYIECNKKLGSCGNVYDGNVNEGQTRYWIYTWDTIAIRGDINYCLDVDYNTRVCSIPGISTIIGIVMKHPLSNNKQLTNSRIKAILSYYIDHIDFCHFSGYLLNYLKGCCLPLNINFQITNNIDANYLKELIFNKMENIQDFYDL